jgi:hypothetical protein
LRIDPTTASKLWAACSKEILKRASHKLAGLGFKRTKPTLFTRPRKHHCEFIHPHKFSGGRHYRLHAGIRIYNSSFPACALNGPHTDGDRRFSLFFEDNPESWERCADEFSKFATLVALPWFETLAVNDSLLGGTSPLRPEARNELRDALAGNVSDDNIALSKKLLGLK